MDCPAWDNTCLWVMPQRQNSDRLCNLKPVLYTCFQAGKSIELPPSEPRVTNMASQRRDSSKWHLSCINGYDWNNLCTLWSNYSICISLNKTGLICPVRDNARLWVMPQRRSSRPAWVIFGPESCSRHRNFCPKCSVWGSWIPSIVSTSGCTEPPKYSAFISYYNRIVCRMFEGNFSKICIQEGAWYTWDIFISKHLWHSRGEGLFAQSPELCMCLEPSVWQILYCRRLHKVFIRNGVLAIIFIKAGGHHEKPMVLT